MIKMLKTFITSYKKVKLIHKLIIPPFIAISIGLSFFFVVLFEVSYIQNAMTILNTRYIPSLEKASSNIMHLKNISEKCIFAILANEQDMLPQVSEKEEIEKNLAFIVSSEKDLNILNTSTFFKEYFEIAIHQAKSMITEQKVENNTKEAIALVLLYNKTQENFSTIKHELEKRMQNKSHTIQEITDQMIYFTFIFIVIFVLSIYILSYLIYKDFNTRFSLLIHKLKAFEILYQSEKDFNINSDELSLISLSIDKKISEFQKLQTDIHSDPLTDLYNRRYLEAYLDTKTFSVLIVDIDYFKKINDNFGHDVGDDVLIRFSSLIKKTIRQEDIAIRYGGEEFLILLKESSKEVLLEEAEELRKAIEKHPFEKVGKMTVSIGCAVSSQSHTLVEIITEADKALYRAKYEGRNKVILSQGEL